MPTDSALDNDNPSEVPSHAHGARFAILDSLFSEWISSLSEIRQARTSQKTRGTTDRAPSEDAAAGITAKVRWISVCRYKTSALAQNLTTIDRRRPKSHSISVTAVGSGRVCSIGE